MEIFLTGGSGTIGSAVARRLINDGHTIVALSRSAESADKIRSIGASSYPGDLTSPEDWVDRAVKCDALVHAGATFDASMGATDRKVIVSLVKAAHLQQSPLKVVYTGGVWLYPEAPETRLHETDRFAPLAAFSWMAENIRTLLTSNLSLAVVHPALVCARGTGLAADMIDAARSETPFKTRATPETIWPLVTDEDLADLYARVLGSQSFRLSVLGAGIEGTSVANLAGAVARYTGKRTEIETVSSDPDVDPKQDWEAGYALSQIVDNSRAAKLTGWKAQSDSLEAIIRHSDTED